MTVSQPLAIDAPRMCCSRIDDEKYTQHCHHYEPASLDDGPALYDVHHFHGNCHQWRLRRVLIPVLLGLLAAFLLLCAISAVRITYFAGMDGGDEGWLGMLDNGFKIMKRAVVETSGNSGSFVHNKLYLIIIFVGIAVVVILGISLTFWCCRGSFRNPLCCPCYLCACCGGLACLECIGCGLCAAVDPI
ncbi:hypothetical protein F5887DRAFT_256443 [Amanita rubescens]|nr:hypothetical protein F5887DRAFT_256443 [Amanita rubescens]